MGLYEISNGWMGESYVRVIVIAENEERALEMAKEAFMREALKRGKDESYYSRFTIEWSIEDLTKPYCSEPTDG